MISFTNIFRARVYIYMFLGAKGLKWPSYLLLVAFLLHYHFHASVRSDAKHSQILFQICTLHKSRESRAKRKSRAFLVVYTQVYEPDLISVKSPHISTCISVLQI